jgi:hypothetical protein
MGPIERYAAAVKARVGRARAKTVAKVQKAAPPKPKPKPQKVKP